MFLFIYIEPLRRFNYPQQHSTAACMLTCSSLASPSSPDQFCALSCGSSGDVKTGRGSQSTVQACCPVPSILPCSAHPPVAPSFPGSLHRGSPPRAEPPRPPPPSRPRRCAAPAESPADGGICSVSTVGGWQMPKRGGETRKGGEGGHRDVELRHVDGCVGVLLVGNLQSLWVAYLHCHVNCSAPQLPNSSRRAICLAVPLQCHTWHCQGW